MTAKISGDQPDKAAQPFSNDESTVYLIKETGLYEPTIKERLASCFKDIFYEELAGWFTNKSKWPKSITWKEFESWFHISFQSVVLDTIDEDIEHE
ncbi:MAG TPA: hypothetical protein DC049_10570 [Spirochaetia bacterium]|nr:hypothetical protein [Spirochaetia bacterium]